MNTAHWLAWVIIVWNVIGFVWEFADQPITRTWNSTFYIICVVLLSFTTLGLSIAVVAG
jgi:hypothetical protein